MKEIMFIKILLTNTMEWYRAKKITTMCPQFKVPTGGKK